MENLIKCPKCNGSDKGCSFCSQLGYVIYDHNSYYTVTLDSKNEPIKGSIISSSGSSDSFAKQQVNNALFNSLFPEPEPHDMEWFFKKK
jgi:hypothetical protein